MQVLMGLPLPSFLRSWVRRIHKRIRVASSKSSVPPPPPPPPEAAPLLDQRVTRLSPAQQLPGEIILEIMGHLIPVAQRRSSLASSPERSAVAVTQSLIRHQLFLLWACKTCRRWYSAGCEVLYSSPLLATPRKMELFERTLSQAPSLARFVKAIYAPIRVEGTTADLFGWVLGRRSLSAQREELSTLLHNCSSLRALTIRHSVRKGIVSRVPIKDVLQSSAHVSRQLESLSLHGSTHETRSAPQYCVLPTLSDMLLPHLQVLCLRGIYVLPSLNLPVLPKLHTLQLVGNHYFGLGPYFMSESLPGLRSLEIVEHRVPEGQLGLKELFDETCLQQIENVRVMQDERCMVVTRSLPFDGKLRRLVLGRISARDHTDLVCWRFPDALESLRLLLKQDKTDHTSCAEIEETLDAVSRCMELNEEAKRVKELVIIVQLDEIQGAQARQATLKEAVDDLQGICDRRGILFRIDPPCTHPHISLSMLDLRCFQLLTTLTKCLKTCIERN